MAAGRAADARVLAEELSSSSDVEAQALAEVLAAEVALAQNDVRGALTRLAQARARADSWWLRWTQGRALLAAKQFAEADSEFDACLRRRGEAVAVFLDDVPTWRVMAPLHYDQGLAREGLGSPGAVESFRTFLAIKAGGDETAGLVAAAREAVEAERLLAVGNGVVVGIRVERIAVERVEAAVVADLVAVVDAAMPAS